MAPMLIPTLTWKSFRAYQIVKRLFIHMKHSLFQLQDEDGIDIPKKFCLNLIRTQNESGY